MNFCTIKIQILKSKLVSHNEYSDYKDIELTFKNTSRKKIIGIKWVFKKK